MSRSFLGVLSVVARCFEARYNRGKRECNLNKQHFFVVWEFLGSSLVRPRFILGLLHGVDIQGTREDNLNKTHFLANTSYIRQTAYPNAIRR